MHLYENDATTHAGSLEIRLRGDGVTANRTGIGAKVSVEAGGVTQVQELGGGYGHMAMEHDTVLHFGLGACGGAANVTVTWPDQAKTTQVFSHVRGNRMVELRQGDPTVYPIELGP